ncbi:MAG TPA: hypothetical protein VM760_08660, partial [Sphingomicrobium sp.]|nr:hypothetical protein [Sphingomicrobium sp.]
EVMSAAQAYDMQPGQNGNAAGTGALYERVRAIVPVYRDDRPLNGLLAKVRDLLSKMAAF